jgi:hypothetical protein
MKSCEYEGAPLLTPRAHPWTDAVTNSAFRYYDLKAEPGLIRTALEDLVPFGDDAAIATFYELLERVNGSQSLLESNDCAFTGPHGSEAPELGSWQSDGRVMLLFRKLELNLAKANVQALKDAVHIDLANRDKTFEHGMIGTTITPVIFVELPVSEDQQVGYQLMFSFWAWGDSHAQVMDNLARVLRNLDQALASVARAD